VSLPESGIPLTSAFQRRISGALLRVLQPLARTVLRFGVGWDEFDQLARSAFVEVATRDYGIRGRPTNISRVSALTGLSRKEIHRIRALPSAGLEEPLSGRSPVAELLHHWHTDPDYLDAARQPLILPYAGAGCSFTGLVRRTGGDLSPAAARRELMRTGAIRQAPDGMLRVLKRDFMPAEADARLIEGLKFGLRSLLATVLYNATAGEGRPPKFQREVHCESIRATRLAEAKRMILGVLTGASERLDSYLSTVEAEQRLAGQSGRRKRVSVGFYYFES
jgi:hypothetical protein